MNRTLLRWAALVLLTSAAHAHAHAQAPAPAPNATLGAPPVPVEQAASDTQRLDRASEGTPALAAESAAASPESSEPATLAGGEAEAQLSAEELEQLGFGSGSAAAAVDTDIKLFGFADFTVTAAAMRKSNPFRDFIGRHASFYIGNLNLFLSKNLSQKVRTMAEVRFLYAPHGSDNPDGSLITTRVTDHADYKRPLNWGGIEIERVYLEWSVHPNLTIRAGQYLTPYGIWNVDHGSPLFIPVQRPYVIGSALFPERQTGFELFGKWDASAHSAIGYHLTLSNGMGPVSEIIDLDDNKAVGGRAFWELRERGDFQLGASAYYGRDTSARTLQGIGPDGAITFKERVTTQSDVLSLAADARWRYRSYHLQLEGIAQQRKYTSRGRFGAASPLAGGQVLFPSDTVNWGVYCLVGYRFEWLGVMPYVLAQSFSEVATNNLRTHSRGAAFGLNVRPIDAVVVKLDYSFALFPKGHLISSDHAAQLLQMQVAWAF